MNYLDLNKVITIQEGIKAINFINDNIVNEEVIKQLISDLYFEHYHKWKKESKVLSQGISVILYMFFDGTPTKCYNLTKQELSLLRNIKINNPKQLYKIAFDTLMN